MTGECKAVFQPADGRWEDYAAREGLRSVLDPADAAGAKNAAIDALHKLALDRALGRRRFARALDFGCGTGRLARHLAPRARRVLGADLTSAMLRRAARESAAANLDYVRFDGRRLPLPDACLDLAVSAYVLQYAVREPSAYAALLGELARVLAPGGLLVCIEQASAGPGASPSVGRAACVADYLEPAERHFRVISRAPVRLGRPGRLERRTLLRPGLPAPLRRAAARLALARVARLPEAALAAQPYADWRFCLARREDAR
jgi:SAM-dependent methyltransferase